MKKFLLLISQMLTFWVVLSQSMGLLQTDSLRRELELATHDTSRILIMANLTEGYRGSKPDSAMFYGTQALQLARQINFPRGEVLALLGISVVLRELGSLPKALDMALKALKISEQKNLTREEAMSQIRVANVFVASKNFRDAQKYYQMADETLKTTKDTFLIAASYFLSADAYERMNKPDSALYKGQLAFELVLTMDNELLWPGLLRVFGNINARKGNTQLASKYYHQSIENALRLKDHRNASASFSDIASFHKNTIHPDSAIYYAKKALEYAELLSYKNQVMKSAILLSELYEPIDAKEALRYYKIANDAKDSLYNSEKVQALQAMSFEEQERQREVEAANIASQNRIKQYTLLSGLAIFLFIVVILYRNNRHKQKANTLLQAQKKEIQTTLSELKATQAQLIQSEKMASLGELTAGIAHEIQNPLNFINNFSEINAELIEEMEKEVANGSFTEIKAITDNIKENEQKISHHGKRADAIVKGMLQHSRRSNGVKESTDINALADEYLRLAYHGLRAKDKSFNATLKTDFDQSVAKVDVIPQDIGRVILNLITNAFYAVDEKRKQVENFEPTVSVVTKKINNKVQITVRDNGNGIPSHVIEKIFQPFFTTKPTGEGTGLGLSMSYDIITKAHGGELKVDTSEGKYAEFQIILPA